MTRDESEPATGSEATTESAATDGAEPAGSLWADLLADANAIAEEYRDEGWDVVVLEPTAVSPVDRDERVGLDVTVSDAEYEIVEELIEEGAVTITSANVYYRPVAADGSERRLALTVERDESSETAIFVPLTYDLSTCRDVFETALLEEQLLTHVTTPSTARWVSFSHDDPSLFLEESDVRAWGPDDE
ncbi:DUF7529 family protein [Natrinema altunense]|uniref:Uncharacterized protein n=1 Tax=Natrinema altunense (strain JCM 12890 / CGMCC 1.3731 / AJ2) TaxID=1227494 RepID=L9ZGE8_NATA2|nr:hypothetical protein [Natrinema altunense]ELY84258.1 hypothetical protein C485_15779 [Natrinema altunense JCM 12890]